MNIHEIITDHVDGVIHFCKLCDRFDWK